MFQTIPHPGRHIWSRTEWYGRPVSESSGAKAGMHLFRSAALETTKIDDPQEHAAERAAESAMSGAPVSQGSAATGRSEGALDPQTRGFMEQRFGEDFGHVEVHTDSRADLSARAFQARAYTTGSHIVFRAGQYAPHTATGRKLIAHELAHVVQQQSSPPRIARSPEAPETAPVSHATEIEALLDRRDPVAGAGSPAQAVAALRDLPNASLILTLRDLRAHGRMDQMRADVGGQGLRLLVAFRAVDLEGQGAAAPEDWARVREQSLRLSPTDRADMVAAVPQLQVPAEPALPASSSTLPAPLLNTLGRSYARRNTGMPGSAQNLDNAFWGGRPATFDAALAALGAAALATIVEIYGRWTSTGLVWSLLDNLLNIWGGGAPGFNFTANVAALQSALEANSHFCEDMRLVGGLYHFVHGETPCWREKISGAHGLHFCLGADTPSVHIDASQVVAGSLLGTCVYDPSAVPQHFRDLGWVP